MCTRPLKGFLNGLTENGKKNLVIAPFTTDHIEFINGHKHYVTDASIHSKSYLKDFVEVPCGQCIECRLNRSRKWADRCMMELQYHTQSWFITLTYDNEHIPKNPMYDPDTGEVYAENATLVKKDFQDFMKRLRRAYEYAGHENKLRFFAAGEYGSETMRPHFHAILFGLELDSDDLTLYKRNLQGDNLYNSKLISSCWKKGFSVVGEVTWQSCAYVARYIMKKHLGKDSEFYDIYNIEPEFTLMSRKPGIARQYYEDHKDELFDYDFVTIPTNQGSRRIYPPPYFEKLFEHDFPDQDVVERKERRKQAAITSMDLQLEKTSKSKLDYLATKEYNLDNKIKALKRGDC